jgi:hypothetical protein
MMPKPSDLARTLAEADRLAREILQRDAAGECGLAVETARALILRLASADAAALLTQRKPTERGFDPKILIG